VERHFRIAAKRPTVAEVGRDIGPGGAVTTPEAATAFRQLFDIAVLHSVVPSIARSSFVPHPTPSSLR
jgi:hypothetical protein